MTEYWKSNPMHWCDVCKVWLQDTKVAKLNHERGSNHKFNLQKKLRDMGRKADDEKRLASEAARAIEKIERAAKEQYEEDLRTADIQVGKWVFDSTTRYYYNDLHRWYYDEKTKYYYGGEPPAWTVSPDIPEPALFGSAPHEGGPVPYAAYRKPKTTSAPEPALKQRPPAHTIADETVTKVIDLPQHPLANAGGYQMPLAGRVGAAKGVGGQAGNTKVAKRSRSEASGDKNLDKEEAAALARREAARQRVQQRTMSTFGLG